MKLLKRVGLFLSSFVPLFCLLIIKEMVEILNCNWTFNFLNTFLLIILIFMLFSSVLILVKTIKELNDFNGEKIKLIKKENLTHQNFLGYFSLFVLFAVTFEIEMYSMALIFFIILFLIGVVYIKNDMYFINPLLNLMGYSFYNIEYETINGELKTVNIFYRGLLEENKIYILSNKFSNLFLVKTRK